MPDSTSSVIQSDRAAIAVPDGGGLICGFTLRRDRSPEPIAWDGGYPGPAGSPVWLHFNLADARACRWLAGCEWLPQPARDLLLDTDEHIHLGAAGPGFAGVIGDLHHDFDDDPEGLGVLRIYVDEHCVITGRRHPLRAIDHLRRELLGGLRVAEPIDLLGHLLQDVVEAYAAVIKRLKEAVDEAEDRILAGRLLDQGTELVRIRRLLARLHRHADAGRRALSPAPGRLPLRCGDADGEHLAQAVERLHGVVQDLELVQERARLLQEEIAGRVREHSPLAQDFLNPRVSGGRWSGRSAATPPARYT